MAYLKKHTQKIPNLNSQANKYFLKYLISDFMKWEGRQKCQLFSCFMVCFYLMFYYSDICK